MHLLISLILGLSVGSFSNVCILRLPAEESLWHPRSHCPRCGHALRNVHNIPLLSFLMLRGRCFDCGKAISWQYPLIEASFAVIFLFHAWYFSNSINRMIFSDILSFYLLTLSVIDYQHRIIPDELSLSLLGLGLLISWVNPFLHGPPWFRLIHSLTACFAGGLFMQLLSYAGEKTFKKEALGGGDVKLIAASGAILGWPGIAGPLLLGSFIGGIGAMILLILKRKKLGETLPFGPFLSLGLYFTCLYPDWWVTIFRP